MYMWKVAFVSRRKLFICMQEYIETPIAYTCLFPCTETIVFCGWFGNHPVPGLAKFRLVLIVSIIDF